jgi:hypothetical protein
MRVGLLRTVELRIFTGAHIVQVEKRNCRQLLKLLEIQAGYLQGKCSSAYLG